MAKRPIVVDTTTDSPLAAIGVHLAKDVPIPKASAPGPAQPVDARRTTGLELDHRPRVAGPAG